MKIKIAIFTSFFACFIANANSSEITETPLSVKAQAFADAVLLKDRRFSSVLYDFNHAVLWVQTPSWTLHGRPNFRPLCSYATSQNINLRYIVDSGNSAPTLERHNAMISMGEGHIRSISLVTCN